MMSKTKLLAFIATFGMLSCGNISQSAAQSRARDGATVGGVAGAVIGGIIGHQNDETPEGALIGGAVGAIAGGLLGQNQDAELRRQAYAQQQAYYRDQQAAYAAQQRVIDTGASTVDVVNMARSGVSESIIIGHLNSRGVKRRLDVNEIISLHQQGVSDTVISAYQAAPLASQTRAVAETRYTQPVQQVAPAYVPATVIHHPSVIVHEPVIVQPRRVYYDFHHGHHYHYRPAPRRGTSIRIGF